MQEEVRKLDAKWIEARVRSSVIGGTDMAKQTLSLAPTKG